MSEDITICDIFLISSRVSVNKKSDGNLLIFLLTAWFRTLVKVQGIRDAERPMGLKERFGLPSSPYRATPDKSPHKPGSTGWPNKSFQEHFIRGAALRVLSFKIEGRAFLVLAYDF
jgi:hypothetical protein